MFTRVAKNHCGVWLVGIFILGTAAVAANETDDTWLTRSWQSEEGLPENSVTGLAQTPDGFLWIGTPSGLARFDGIRFEEFSLTHIITAPNRGVVTMTSGRQGSLLLGMDRGAAVYLNGGLSRAHAQGLPNLIPGALAEDADGSLWISYHNGSVYQVKTDQIVSPTTQQGLPNGSDTCALTSDRQGRVWFAKAGQVGICRQGVFQTLCRIKPQPMRLASSKDGGVWICAGSQLFKCDKNGRLVECGAFHPENSGSMATAMIEDREGAVWIGTSFNGLYRHDASGFEMISTSAKEILSLLEDREGNIWVGTFGGGLDRIRRRAITLEGVQAGLPIATIQSICEANDGTLWATTLNGVLVHRENEHWSAIPETDRWPGTATCVCADLNGSVWVGSRRGLYCWRNGQFVTPDGVGQLQGTAIHTLLTSRTGDLWLGTENPDAIVRLHNGQLQNFAIPPESRIIRTMVEDAAGTIWAGTSKGVLLRVAGDKAETVTLRPAQEPAPIRRLYATSDGALWIGYAGWGLGHFKKGHYAEVSSEQGLFDNYISHIITDDHGWLWFGANRGIFKVRQSDLEDVFDGRMTHIRSIHYGRGEGLPSLQATFGESPDILHSRDGQLWIPMQTALVVVAPEKLKEVSEPPPMQLTRVLVDDHLVAQYGGILPKDQSNNNKVLDLAATNAELRLPPGHRRIEIDFTALSFSAPENVQFRYRLKGFDEEWTEADTRRLANYERLPSGNYSFEMSACNNEGEWNKTSTRLSLVVEPFFWQTAWFRLLVMAGFTVSIIAIVRYVSFRRLQQQLHKLEQQAVLQKERTRIAKDIHDDLGANLTQIAFLGELAQQDRREPDKVAERIGKISTAARQSVKSLDDIVWAVNPRNDTLAHLVDYAGQFALDYMRLAGLRCRLDFPEQTPSRECSTDLRHNLFLVIKEALHNIVKHAGATEVWLRASLADDTLEFVIQDNGHGFIGVPDDALADGLRNMRQRMADIGGEFLLESNAESGTKVRLRLPLAKT